MVAREPDMGWPFTPMRRREAIEHDEGGLRMLRSQRIHQAQPELKLIGVDVAVFSLP